MTKKISVKFWAILISVSVFCIALLVAGIVIVNKNRVKVSFDLGLPELVENAEEFKTMKFWKGDKLEAPIPTMEVAKFDGWLVPAGELGYAYFDVEQPLTEDITLYADWVLDETDANGNGVGDVYEAYLGYPEIEAYLDSDGDGVSDVNIDKLYRTHRQSGKLVTMTAVHPEARFGQMVIDGDSITGFEEKPPRGDGYINGGFMVIQKEFIGQYLTDDPKMFLERTPLGSAAANGDMGVYRHDGFWQCMDNQREYQLLNDLWKKRKAPWTKYWTRKK